MIIDFHTHSFPDDIADRAVGRLAQSGGIPNYLDGRVDSIKASMEKAGIDYSVLLPIATKPSQHTTINKIAIETNKSFKSTGIISFGTIHPDNDDYKTIISDLAKAGVPGIKVKAEVSGIYITGIKSVRGGKIVVEEKKAKKGLFKKLKKN